MVSLLLPCQWLVNYYLGSAADELANNHGTHVFKQDVQRNVKALLHLCSYWFQITQAYNLYLTVQCINVTAAVLKYYMPYEPNRNWLPFWQTSCHYHPLISKQIIFISSTEFITVKLIQNHLLNLQQRHLI